jgi:TetR/AcrR family acrAB operon transcriptional repressor
MKKTKQEAEQTRQVVLDAALKTFTRRGFSRTTLEEVAKEAGMTRGAIYWHFKNKYQLLDSVIEQVYQKLKGQTMEVINSPISPINKIRQLMINFFRFIAKENEFKVIEEYLVFKFQTAKEVKRFYQKHKSKMEEMLVLMKTLFNEGIKEGELDTNIDPEVGVMALISFVGGVKTPWISEIENFSLSENASSLVEIFINGIARKG